MTKQKQFIFKQSLKFIQFNQYIEELFSLFPEDIAKKLYNLSEFKYHFEGDNLKQDIEIKDSKNGITILKANCNEMSVEVKIREVADVLDAENKPVLKCKVSDKYRNDNYCFSFGLKTIEDKSFLECKQDEIRQNLPTVTIRYYRDIDIDELLKNKDLKV